MTEITVLRPDTPDAPRSRLDPAPRGDLPQHPVIGLIANGKPLARELLEALGDELRRRLRRDVELELLCKPSAAYPITGAQADGMAARAHMVITGVGD